MSKRDDFNAEKQALISAVDGLAARAQAKAAENADNAISDSDIAEVRALRERVDATLVPPAADPLEL